MTLRQPLFAKYAIPIMALAGVALLVSGAVEIYFSHRLHRATLAEVQRDKAHAAASSVSSYVGDLAQGVALGTVPASDGAAATLERRRIEYLRLLRVAPAITTLRFIDSHGAERLQVSRLDADRTNSEADFSRDAGFIAAHKGRVYFGPIYFFEQTEPYMSIAVPDGSGDGSVTISEVNLKFIWSVVMDIRIGGQGYAYVVDARGGLVAHPDIHRVLQVTDLSMLPQVRAAFAQRDSAGPSRALDEDAVDPQGRSVLAAHAAIPPLGWFVFVEQLRSEALAPLYAAVSRTAVVLLLALGLALLASLLLARRMVAPIRQLQAGAQKIGAGELGHRIQVNTGDELEELSAQFNRMGGQLQESYAGLERRIAERTRDLDAANQAKSRFLAAASHDLRQPIHALGLLAAQLDSCRCPADRNAVTAQIRHGIATLGDLFDDLLDISKLEAGAVVAHCEDFAISAVLDAVSAQFAPVAREKGLEFKILPSNACVRSDPVLLKRILSNFVSNAVRYTERGRVLAGCRRRRGRLQIAVWDTGCGIPAERRDDIFREFVQLESTHRDRGEGLGLGLAIVARLAPLLGSHVEVKSVPGRGSMFAIRVPLADATAGTSAALTVRYARDPVPITPLTGVFAIVVDDDAGARAGMQSLLERWGCLVLAASGAAEALGILALHDRAPDLIICDYHLAASENGIEAISRIRAAFERAIPAILVTADAHTEMLRGAEAQGYPTLQKPLSPAKLRALLNQLLAKTRSEHTRVTPQELA